MPFELGLAIGARSFGGVRQRRKRVLCLVEKRYDMPKFLSDAAGQDPHPHANNPDRVIKLVRNWLKNRPDGVPLPGPTAISNLFKEFQSDAPGIADARQLTRAELDPFKGHYNDFLSVLQLWYETLDR